MDSLAIALALVLSWPSPSVAPQAATVTVRLVYYQSGKPAKGIGLFFFEGDPQKIPPAEEKDGSRAPRAITSQDGTAVFQIAPPLPDFIFSSIDDDRVTACATMPLVPLKQALEHGFALTLDAEFGKYCKGSPQILEKILPKPGEILIFIRKRSFWEIYG